MSFIKQINAHTKMQTIKLKYIQINVQTHILKACQALQEQFFVYLQAFIIIFFLHLTHSWSFKKIL